MICSDALRAAAHLPTAAGRVPAGSVYDLAGRLACHPFSDLFKQRHLAASAEVEVAQPVEYNLPALMAGAIAACLPQLGRRLPRINAASSEGVTATT